MKQPKCAAHLLCLICSALMLSVFCAGCSHPAESKPVPEQTEAPVTETVPAETEPETTAPPEPERGHYVFQPKVCSPYIRELFGDVMCDTWFHLVDAVMAGEDTFPCPDADTYGWVCGQFPNLCFPVLDQLIAFPYDDSFADGVGTIQYLVPKEEAAAQIAAFSKTVEDILNEALRDDDSDFEKALALYLYFAEHYTYDYELMENNTDASALSACHVFSEQTGICQEFSVAYSYLLMQAGVDATVMKGIRSYDGGHHQWSYVRIGGKNYHIDPTYVLGTDSLSYFLMSDAQREYEDCYPKHDFVITSVYAQEYGSPAYNAEDITFSELWNSDFVSLDRERNLLTYRSYEDSADGICRTFSYDGF